MSSWWNSVTGRSTLRGAPEAVHAITPPSMLNSLLLRLERLRLRVPGAEALARAAAVLGDGAALRHAAALAEVPEDEAADALDALTDAELLAPGEPLRFLHPLVRTAIHSAIPAGRRAAQHARAAQLLAADGVDVEKVALHLLHAPRAASPVTVTWLRAAAARARSAGAPQSAVAYLRRAIEEPPTPARRGDVLIELAHVETAIGDTEAVSRLAEALELISDAPKRARVLLELGWGEHHRGRFQDAADAFEAGLTVAAGLAESDPDLEAELEAGYLVSATLDSRRVADAISRIEVIERRSGEIQVPAHRMLLAQLLFTRTMAGAPHHEIIELAERIWAGGQLLRDEGADSQTLWHVVGALSWADACTAALAVIEQALAAADEQGLVLAQARARYARAWPHLWMGQIGAAAADAWAAIEIWNGGLETYLPAAIYWFGLASLERGDGAAAERALALAGPASRWEETGMMGFIHSLSGHLALRAGRVAEAAESFQACGAVMETLMITSPAVMPWRSDAAHALHVLGERRRAGRLAQEELELARANGAPRAIGVALRAAGRCAGGGVGLRLLQEATEVLAGSSAALELARAQIDLGAAIRREGRRRDARPHLQAGLALAQSGGATVLAGHAETELRAAGGRGRRATHTGPGMLTASERRVAELAAVGHRNRQIAGLLQISVKAVEWHLHQCYRKLDIEGRGQLGTALGTSPPAALRPAIVR